MRDLDAPAPTPAQRAAHRVAWYKTPTIWRGHDAEAEPWTVYTSSDLLPWWGRHPTATCSERTAKALLWLEDTFAKA